MLLGRFYCKDAPTITMKCTVKPRDRGTGEDVKQNGAYGGDKRKTMNVTLLLAETRDGGRTN